MKWLVYYLYYLVLYLLIKKNNYQTTQSYIECLSFKYKVDILKNINSFL